MKNKWLSIFSLLFVIACNDTKQSAEKNIIEKVKENQTLEGITHQDTIQQIETKGEVNKQAQILMQSHWVSDEWLKNIEKEKSIYKNEEIPTKSEMMGFDFVGKIQGYGTHEGGFDSELIFDEKQKIYKNDEINIEKNFFKTPFQLEIIDNQMVQLVFQDGKKDVYRSVKDFPTVFRELLLEGKYINQDTDEEVEFFAKNGKIVGWEGKNTYEFLYDLFEFEFDVIKIDSELYHYKIKKDTITLYKITEEEEMVFTWKKKSFVFKKV